MNIKSFKRTVIDIETNGLLNHLIDFSTMPFKFKPTANLYTIVLTNKDDTSEQVVLKSHNCTKDILKEAFSNTEEIIFHNGIKFDAVALQLFKIFNYKVYFKLDKNGNNGEVFGKPVKITDTLILSKILNPDRWFGHSLEAWGKFLGDYKEDYRQVCIDKGYIEKNSPSGSEFAEYHEEIIPYCIQDTKVTSLILDNLLVEIGKTDVSKFYHMELKLADLTVKQELYGFKFNTELAKFAVTDLTTQLTTLANNVNPVLPPKRLNKGEQKDFLPPARQFKANGDLSAFLEKFISKIGAVLNEEKTSITFDGKEFTLPLDPNVCLKETITADIDDLDHLKAYLLSLNWNPLEWKERDLTRDSKKKKLDSEKYKATVERYVDNTLNGVYRDYRLEIIGVEADKLLDYLLSKQNEFAVRVPVSPSIRIGTEKRLCPHLEDLGEQANFVSDVVKYLTFKHRKNSISGGTEDEDGSPTTGFLSLVREDGRIATPADTIGAGTGRYRHIGVANIPRVSSLYGSIMRALFGPGDNRIQFGFDFSSLEARVNGHFVMPYTNGAALAESLIAEKPNDCFDIDTEILTDLGWVNYKQITDATNLAQWNVFENLISYTKPEKIIVKESDTMIKIFGDRVDLLVTPSHRIVVYNEDKEEYQDVYAKDLKEYVANNPNCFLPSSASNNQSDSLDLVIDYYLNDLNIRKDFEEVIQKDSGWVVSSFDKDLIDQVQEELFINNCTSFIIEKVKNQKPLYQTFIPKESFNLKGLYLRHTEITEVFYNNIVWCVSVPDTYVVVRRNNKIVITGNCHTLNAKRLGIDRDAAKSFGYAVMYGAQPNKLAKMLRISEKEAKRLFNLYWDGVPALRELKTKVEQFWEATNKQYILSIDKRKLLVRSKHSLVNLLFQSTGALLMKYTTIEIAERLDNLGILGDPLLHTDQSDKVFQMIIYHDEAQYSCPKSMFKITKFTDEKLAKACKISKSGAESHVGEEYWVAAENVLSTIVDQSVDDVAKMFNLKVPLGVEWKVGDSWASCH